MRNAGGLEECIVQFGQEYIDLELKQVQTQIERSLGEWAEGLKSEYRKHEQSIRELHEMGTAIPKSIMIIDDDELYSNILQQMLESAAYKVSRAEDGRNGLAIIARTKPDLVIMDFEMPGINGVEVMRILKRNPITKNIPVIMLTGFSNDKTVQDAIASGAADFLIKPVERAALIDKISNQLD